MKVVLDTNVLVSGTFWTGKSFEIIKKIDIREIELILSEEIIEEYHKIISSEEIIEKICDKNLIANQAMQKIIQDSIIVFPTTKFNIIQDDFDDNKILECAFEGKADYVISQDKHLLDLKEFKGIKILTPDDFLKTLE